MTKSMFWIHLNSIFVVKMFSETIGVLHNRGIFGLLHSCWRSCYISSQSRNSLTATRLYPKHMFGYQRVNFGYEKWRLQTRKRFFVIVIDKRLIYERIIKITYIFIMKMFSEAICVLHYRGILGLLHCFWRSCYISSQACNSPTATQLYPKHAFSHEKFTFGYQK